jgi:uncharacterized Zn finger protein
MNSHQITIKEHAMSETEKEHSCTSVEHHGHLCELESQQEWDVIKEITDHPTVTCGICGNLANSAMNVCMPEEL